MKRNRDALENLLHNSMGYPLSKDNKSSLRLKDFDTIISKNTVLGGVYWIQKLPNENYDWLDMLELKPHKNNLAPCAPKPFSVCYAHPTKKDWIGLPRFLGLSMYGLPEKDIRTLGLEMSLIIQLRNDAKLHEYQETAKSNTLTTLEKWGGATIIADCGAGKTLMALSIALALKRKTLILCNRSFLMQQWKYDICGKEWTWSNDNSISKNQNKEWRIKCAKCKFTQHLSEDKFEKNCTKCNFEFCVEDKSWTIEPKQGWINHSRVGWLQSSDIKKHDYIDKDFVISSIESISQCNYSKDILLQFGTVIIDEMHHLGSLTLSQVLPLLPSRYIIGISATPERNDGLEHALYWLAGPTSFVWKRLPSITGKSNTVIVKKILFEDGDQKQIIYKSGQMGFAQMITLLSQDEKRNLLIIDLIKKSIEEGRKKVLIVTSIVDHAKYLCESLKEFKTCLVYGGCKPNQLTIAKSNLVNVVVATYQFLEEGYDDNTLDTLIMALPRSKIQQVVGRCERTHENKLVPIVYDIVDTFSVFEAMGWKRIKFYKSRGFKIN